MAVCKVIGYLSDDMIDSIGRNKPEFLKQIRDRKIIMWDDRLEHINKHKYDFESVDEFEKYVNLIPDIVNRPDYLAIREKDNSILFIKEYEKNLLVAVRVNAQGKLPFRTIYPITDSQKNDYLKKGNAWKL